MDCLKNSRVFPFIANHFFFFQKTKKKKNNRQLKEAQRMFRTFGGFVKCRTRDEVNVNLFARIEDERAD